MSRELPQSTEVTTRDVLRGFFGSFQSEEVQQLIEEVAVEFDKLDEISPAKDGHLGTIGHILHSTGELRHMSDKQAVQNLRFLRGVAIEAREDLQTHRGQARS